jgi:hypothetical protein
MRACWPAEEGVMDAVSGQGPDEQNEDVQARQLRYECRLPLTRSLHPTRIASLRLVVGRRPSRSRCSRRLGGLHNSQNTFMDPFE